MTRRATILATCLALLPQASQAEFFMFADGVQGNSAASGYQGWFDAHSVTWSIERQTGAVAHTLDVVLETSAGTATLAQVATGRTLPRIIVDHTASFGGLRKVFLRLTCEEASIRRFASASNGSQNAVVEVKIQCGRLQWDQVDFNNSGEVTRNAKGAFNFRTNSP